MMDELAQTAPALVISNVKTETVVSMLLHKQHGVVERMIQEGIVNDADGDTLVKQIDKKLELLHAKAAKADIFKMPGGRTTTKVGASS